jgi:hypothetical protein
VKRALFWPLWGWPLAIATLSAAGLVGGLLGNGTWDWLGWTGLGAPCIAALRFGPRWRPPR